MNTTQRKIEYLKGNCPICSGARKDCRKIGDRVHCLSGDKAPTGWKFIGEDRIGFFVYGPAEDGENDSPQPQPHSTQAKVEPLDLESRDRHYRRMHRRCALSRSHREAILARPLVIDSELAALSPWLMTWPGRDRAPDPRLPGANARGTLLALDGYAIAIPSPTGEIAGWQVKDCDGSWKWASSSTAPAKLPNGEMPLGVYGHGDRVYLAEGFLKPAIASLRFGGRWIGAAGGHWASSPQQLLAAIGQARTVTLAADGGASGNYHVAQTYRRLHSLLASVGIALEVAWWGQREKSHGDIDEISPRTWETAQSLPWADFWAIAEDDGGATPPPAIAQAQAQQRQKPPTPKPPPRWKATELYSPGARLTAWVGAMGRAPKGILYDASPPGTGKSHTAGLLTPEAFGVERIFYVSNDHRNPTTSTLGEANGWQDMESRHNGLYQEESGKWRRVTQGQTPAIASNCRRTALATTLQSKGLEGANTADKLCGGCKLRDACTHAEGPGYGFLNQRKEALSQEKIRIHPSSLPNPANFDYSSTLLVIDEIETMATTREISVDRADLEATIARLKDRKLTALEAIDKPHQATTRETTPEAERAVADAIAEVEPFLERLMAIFNREESIGRWGWDLTTLRAKMPQAPTPEALSIVGDILSPEQALKALLNPASQYGEEIESLPRKWREHFEKPKQRGQNDRRSDATILAQEAESKILKQWIGKCWAILGGTEPGSLRLSPHSLTLTIPDFRLRNIHQAGAKILILDATASPEIIALKLGAAAADIHAIAQDVPPPANLTIKQVGDLGKLGTQRGADQERRVEAAIAEIKAQDPQAQVIGWKKDNRDGAWFRDNRGSNDFQAATTLILDGTPSPHLGAIKAEWEAMSGETDGEAFADFYRAKVDSELVQAIHRLRPSRRAGEALTIYVLSNFPLELEGIPIQAIAAKDITPAAGSKIERTEMAIREAFTRLTREGRSATQSAIAALLGKTQGYISRFRELLLSLRQTLNRESNNPPPPPPPPLKLDQESLSAMLGQIAADYRSAAEWRDALSDWLGMGIPPEDLVQALEDAPLEVHEMTIYPLLATIT